MTREELTAIVERLELELAEAKWAIRQSQAVMKDYGVLVGDGELNGEG